MDHTLCLNKNSFSAKNNAVAYSLFSDAISSTFQLTRNSEDRVNILYETEKKSSFLNISLAEDYKISDFLEQLVSENKNDLAEVVLEMFDKSPVLDNLSDEDYLEISESGFFFPDEPYNGSNDILAIAWFYDAILLSMATSPKWEVSTIDFSRYTGKPKAEPYSLRNISKPRHVDEIFTQKLDYTSELLISKIELCKLSEEMREWFDSLDSINKKRTFERVCFANSRKFLGGKPLFDTLVDADGMREIRFPAYPSGAIRILFGSLPNNSYGLFVGFIKKSNSDGYGTNIPLAKKVWNRLKEKQ